MKKKWKCNSDCTNQCEVKIVNGQQPNSCVYTWGGSRKFEAISKEKTFKELKEIADLLAGHEIEININGRNINFLDIVRRIDEPKRDDIDDSELDQFFDDLGKVVDHPSYKYEYIIYALNDFIKDDRMVSHAAKEWKEDFKKSLKDIDAFEKSSVPNIRKVPLIPEEKVELMTLGEAIEASKDNDTIKHHSVFGLDVLKKDYEDYKVTIFRALEKKWQIIPAAPKVLSADEIIYEKCGLLSHGEYEYPRLRKVADAADKNGQLKERLNHKELREAVENFLKSIIADYSNGEVVKLAQAFDNLKPITKNE